MLPFITRDVDPDRVAFAPKKRFLPLRVALRLLNDRIDARKLAELLQNNQLRSVYHGDHGLRALKELARSYLTITKDLTRVMTRVKAIYRSWAIPCSGQQVYAPRHRAEWLGKIAEPGVRLRAERSYQQLDLLQPVRQQARRDLLPESRKRTYTSGYSELFRMTRFGRH